MQVEILCYGAISCGLRMGILCMITLLADHGIIPFNACTDVMLFSMGILNLKSRTGPSHNVTKSKCDLFGWVTFPHLCTG